MVMRPITEDVYLALLMQNKDHLDLPLYLQKLDGIIEVIPLSVPESMLYLNYDGKAYVGYQYFTNNFKEEFYLYSAPLFQIFEAPRDKDPVFVFEEFCRVPPILRWHPIATSHACLTFK